MDSIELINKRIQKESKDYLDNLIIEFELEILCLNNLLTVKNINIMDIDKLYHNEDTLICELKDDHNKINYNTSYNGNDFSVNIIDNIIKIRRI